MTHRPYDAGTPAAPAKDAEPPPGECSSETAQAACITYCTIQAKNSACTPSIKSTCTADADCTAFDACVGKSDCAGKSK